jgi:hypothetical protein
MKDIEQFLRQKEAISACFKMTGNRCRMAVATEDGSHLREIVDDWDTVKEDDSDLHYLFRYMPFLDRGEQLSQIQKLIRTEDYTPILKSTEQRVADLSERRGADEVYCVTHDDRILFLIEGEGLNEELPEDLTELRTESDRMLLFFAPWFGGITEGTADKFRKRGEPLL